MIDLHCHVLPGLDDGPRFLKESLDMARTAVNNNIQTIVATPHSLNGFFVNTWESIVKVTSSVQDALQRENIELNIYPGVEVQMGPDLFEALERGEAATINNNGRYMLVEFPAFSMPAGAREFIFKLKLQDITPIIAHPERHLILQHDLNQLHELVNQGALCQLTALSLTGEFGGTVKKSAEEMIRTGLAHVIATDAHFDNDRINALAKSVDLAAEVMQDYSRAEQMVTKTPAAIINGEDVDLPEPDLKKKKRFFF
jgi:protein-tyrosine phosphatase